MEKIDIMAGFWELVLFFIWGMATYKLLIKSPSLGLMMSVPMWFMATLLILVAGFTINAIAKAMK